MSRNSGFSPLAKFFTFVGAAALGAGTALLLTPKTGKEARKNLARLAEDAKDLGLEYVEKGREYLDLTKAQVESALDAAKSVLEAARKA